MLESVPMSNPFSSLPECGTNAKALDVLVTKTDQLKRLDARRNMFKLEWVNMMRSLLFPPLIWMESTCQCLLEVLWRYRIVSRHPSLD